MTEFGTAAEVPDADRAEQAPAVPGGTIVGDISEADALEQQLPTTQAASSPPPSIGDREADAADVLEQEAEVPVDDDETVG